MKINYDLVGDKVTVVLHKGESRGDFKEEEVVDKAVFEVDKLPKAFDAGEAGTKTLAGYGLLKLLQDRTSQEKGGKEKFEAMKAEFDRLGAAIWRKPVTREGGGRTRSVDAILCEAVAKLKKISVPQASMALKALDKESFEAIVGSEKVQKEVEKIKEKVGEPLVELADLL